MNDTTKTEWLAKFEGEWRRLVRDPLFAFYGGENNEWSKAKYLARRLEEIEIAHARYYRGA